ncbi:hypothetical protein AMECASPLE_019930 [Ameca splendens]|uniref:Uncharacterized protein n=1 Tax=Ameca splendens TaxID=208324 RepID=A0ABV0XS37_9TELE
MLTAISSRRILPMLHSEAISGEIEERGQVYLSSLWPSLEEPVKAGNLSDIRPEDSYPDRRPSDAIQAQVKTRRGFISKETSFLLVYSSRRPWFILFFPVWTTEEKLTMLSLTDA